MAKQWLVKIRKNCLVCGQKIEGKRYRTYCSTKCRNRRNNQKYYKRRLKQAREKRGEYKKGKVKCLICGKWYVQVGTHIVERHKLLAREYRELYELPVKKGITPIWYKELKGEQAIENGTYKNLKEGKKYHFKKGDKRAKIKHLFYKGQYEKVKRLDQSVYPH